MIREWLRISEEHRDILRTSQQAIPVRLSELAKKLGLKVVSSTLPTGISGEIRPASGRYVISVNRHDSSRRQRFTVAHEIAHFLLHRDQIGTGITDDVLYRSSLSDSREAEANRLAAEILMPRDKVAEKMLNYREMSQDDMVSSMAAAFEVSEVAMKIRLGLP